MRFSNGWAARGAGKEKSVKLPFHLAGLTGAEKRNMCCGALRVAGSLLVPSFFKIGICIMKQNGAHALPTDNNGVLHMKTNRFCSANSKVLFLFLSMTALASCAYKDRVQPLTLPTADSNYISVNGLYVSATAYVDEKKAENAFGFNIRKAGLLPVQLSFQNEGATKVEILPEQTFLLDEKSHAWPISTRERTYFRVEKYVNTGEAISGTVKPGLLMAAAGAVVGLAVGIVTGENIGEAAGKGAVIGAAAGAIGGGADAYMKAKDKIRTDLRQKSLENKQILPNQIGYGVLFFPGFAEEATGARTLKLSLAFDGEVQTVNIDLTATVRKG